MGRHRSISFHKYSIPNGIDLALCQTFIFLSRRDIIFIETIKTQTNKSPVWDDIDDSIQHPSKYISHQIEC
jgi:hypothetical protein